MVVLLTQNQPKVYNSSTRIYTGITTGSSIVSLEASKVDLFATRTAFDNLINIINSRSTMEEVSLRLLATHLMLEKPIPEIISEKSYASLMEIVPEEVKKLVVNNNMELTLANLKTYKESNYSNFIYKLVNYDHPHYSSNKINSHIKVRRIQSSDIVEITSESNDPGICKNTLEILTDVFIHEYTNIKVNQSDAVVKYFESQIEHSIAKLDDAEIELLEFNRRNIIINYYEQTKHIAAEKELFNMRFLEIKFQNAGAESVLKALEKKMSEREKQLVLNDTISSLRQELTKVNLDIAMKSFEAKTDSASERNLIREIAEQRTKAFKIEKELKNIVNAQYYMQNGRDGVSSESILRDWIEKVIELESTTAQLKVAELQSQQFDRLFESYAPLGATMKRLERKIDVAEREYLSLLHSLSLAKLNQQNIELNSNLKVVTEALFPIVAQPSKRKFLVIIAFMIGFVIPLFVIILLEFLDQNIKTAPRATEFIGLNVAAIFPRIGNINKKLDVEFITKRGLDAIARRLILNTEQQNNNKKPDTNLLFSIQDVEGKTMLATLLLEKLSDVGYKTLFITNQINEEIKGVDILKYTINNAFHRIQTINDFEAEFDGLTLESYDYIFIEIPGILNHTYPINLFKHIGHSFLVTRANRAWGKADSFALNDIIEFTKDNKPQILLNGVEMNEMENLIGDLPKRRSRFRRFVKKTINMEFFSKNKFSSSQRGS